MDTSVSGKRFRIALIAAVSKSTRNPSTSLPLLFLTALHTIVNSSSTISALDGKIAKPQRTNFMIDQGTNCRYLRKYLTAKFVGTITKPLTRAAKSMPVTSASLTSFCCLHCWIWKCLTFSSVVDFEQLNVCWEFFYFSYLL